MGLKLTASEIQAAFNTEALRLRFPPILNTEDAVELLRLKSRKTLYVWIAEGRLTGSFRKRGKHHFFWRDKLIDLIFNSSNWSDECKKTTTRVNMNRPTAAAQLGSASATM
jgi:hypothetical protein